MNDKCKSLVDEAKGLKELTSLEPSLGPPTAILSWLVDKHGVTLDEAKEALLECAIKFYAEPWSVRITSQAVYRHEYGWRHGACNFWGAVIKCLQKGATDEQ